MATRRAQNAASLALALVIVSVVLIGSAVAQPAVGCGSVITSNTRLTTDVGPCPGEGIVIAADNITVNLDGHRVLGNPQARGSGLDKAGVMLRQVHGVTLENGTVEGFDAGVVIGGGAGNTVTRVTAIHNVNYRLITGRNALPGQINLEKGPFCDLGDGIAVLDSKHNVLSDNVVAGNGPYSGVALVGQSDYNTLRGNAIADNDRLNQPPSGGVEGTICGGLSTIGPLGRWVQDVGVRVEGPGATHNVIRGNRIIRSAVAGVMVTGFVIKFGMNNGYNEIRNNHISQTGLRTHQLVGPSKDSYRSSGIVLHNSGSSAVSASFGNIVQGNNSSHNFGAGIEVTGTFPGSGQLDVGGNTIRSNVVTHNFLDGIHLAQGTVLTTVTGNVAHDNGRDRALIAKVTRGDPYSVWDGVDGADNNPGCGSDNWSLNVFDTVNQKCVATHGTGKVIDPIRAAAARARRPSLSPGQQGRLRARRLL